VGGSGDGDGVPGGSPPGRPGRRPADRSARCPCLFPVKNRRSGCTTCWPASA